MKHEKKSRFIVLIVFLTAIALACFFLLLDLLEPIKEGIAARSWKPLTDKFASYGFWSFFFIGLANTIQVLMTVLPGEPIQIISGVTLGPTFGLISCLTGVFLGNLIIYILVRILKTNPLIVYREKAAARLNKVGTATTRKARILMVLTLYFLPVIPYGLIAFTAAKTKMKFKDYIFTTTLGTIPSIALCIWFGTLLLKANYIPLIVTGIFLLILTLITLKYYNKIFDYLEKKYTKDMRYFQNNPRLPSRWFYSLVCFILRIILFRRFRVSSNSKKFKNYPKPYLLIYNHPSFYDWMYAFIPLYPDKINAIMNYYYFTNYHLGTLLNKIGAFPKFLFQPDICAIKNIKRLIKKGGIVGIAPEGRLSPHGRMETITPATAKLIKNLGVPVLLAKINGAYLSYPKWAGNIRRGRIDVDYRELFSAETLQQCSIEEIETVLTTELDYDDFKWQAENQVAFKGKKFAEGLEHILYICPVCHREFSLATKDNQIKCSHCETEITLNNYYQFVTAEARVPANIPAWFEWQKETEAEKINKIGKDFRMETKVTLKMPDPEGGGMKTVGRGQTVMTPAGITYYGTVNNENKEIEFKIQNIPAIPFGVKEDFEISHHNTLYYFIPDDIRVCVKWSVVGEQLHYKYLKEHGNE